VGVFGAQGGGKHVAVAAAATAPVLTAAAATASCLAVVPPAAMVLVDGPAELSARAAKRLHVDAPLLGIVHPAAPSVVFALVDGQALQRLARHAVEEVVLVVGLLDNRELLLDLLLRSGERLSDAAAVGTTGPSVPLSHRRRTPRLRNPINCFLAELHLCPTLEEGGGGAKLPMF